MTWPYAPPSSDASCYDEMTDALALSDSVLRPSDFSTVKAFVAATSHPTVRGPLPANNREALLGGRASPHEPGDSAPPSSVLSPARGSSEGSRHE